MHAPFSRIEEVLGAAGALPLDGCLVDLGVSSPQLDRAERGFSFRRSGPLDMRMDRRERRDRGRVPAPGRTRRSWPTVLRELGEERYARPHRPRHRRGPRSRRTSSTTGALAALVARSVPRREHHKDPATRTFQALRMAVNRELPELERLLADVPGCLRRAGGW